MNCQKARENYLFPGKLRNSTQFNKTCSQLTVSQTTVLGNNSQKLTELQQEKPWSCRGEKIPERRHLTGNKLLITQPHLRLLIKIN